MTPEPISCDQHDYIEVACLYGYRVRLYLTDGQILEGKAKDVKTVDQHEYLILDNGENSQVELKSLSKLEVLTPHAKFESVDF